MKNYGLIGYPLGHSFSGKYFSEKFEKENIDARYELYELPEIQSFNKLVKSVDLSGLNVTIPYKETVIPYLDELDETAAEIGAVNVIQFKRGADKITLKGYNTDVIGFINAIHPRLKAHHQKALILGTGGAAKAMAYGLRKLGVAVTFVSRSRAASDKLQAVSGSFRKEHVISYKDLNKDILLDNLLIINATPVGTYPAVDNCPDIPYIFLTVQHLLFDAVYNPAETLFLKKGRAQGAFGMNGEQMLIGQAEAAWKVWRQFPMSQGTN